jgi:hypothetical protein
LLSLFMLSHIWIRKKILFIRTNMVRENETVIA